MTFRPGFRRSAWRSSGRISARSWAIEKCFRRKSVWPGGDVVVGVVRAGHEVRGAHRLAQVAEAEAAARVEEVAHDRVAIAASAASRCAEESVIEAPKPSMRW